MAISTRRGARSKVRASSATAPRHPQTHHAILLSAILASLVYANSLGNGFVFDDHLVLAHARDLQTLGSFHKVFDREPERSPPLPADQEIAHRPIRTIAMAIEYRMFGSNPVGYRVINILLHALNGLLVFVILRALVSRPWLALIAASLFIVHPIQSESVAYIAGQRDLLFTLLYLLGFLSYVRYRETERAGYLALAGVSYLLGLFTKEMAITLPLLWVAYDLFRSMPGVDSGVALPLRQALRTGLRTIVARSKWLYLVMGAVLALFLFYFAVVANPSHQRTLYGGGLGPTLVTSARIFVHDLKQMAFPATLNVDSYGAFSVSRSLTDPRGLLAFTILAGVWYGLVRGLQADRWITFGGLWFFLALLPVSQIIPHQELVAEHFLYLPSVGFFLAASLIVERGLAVPRAAPVVAAALATALVLLAARTVVRNRDWKDELTLWSKAVQAAPHSYWSHQRLGDAYKSLGRYDEAIREYIEVQALTPGYPTEYIAIGDSYRRMGRYEEAADQFRQALAITPGSVAGRLGLAQAYLAMGLLERAREVHRPIAGAVSKTAQDFRATGDARLAEGRAVEALQAYRNGLEFNPFDPLLHLGLGRAHTALGQDAEAATANRMALMLDPASGAGQDQSHEVGRAASPFSRPDR